MRTKHVLFLIAAILVIAGWQIPARAQDIPTNYNQNPNIEHEFSTLFWSGFDDTYFGIYSHPWDYQTEEFAHSGRNSMEIWVQPGGAYGTWIWVSYPIRGHEQKKFKTSFWYKGYLVSYWNFLYRDAGLTFEDLPPSLIEYSGADTGYWGGDAQNAIKFDFGGDSDYTADWTYFEFVWDFPGTIPGWGNTAMWYANRDSAYVDDIYYGEWYDGVYSGEEPFGFINGDFEKSQLNYEWLVNMGVTSEKTPDDFISLTENHSEAGYQSLRLMDYKEVTIDESVTPVVIDTSTEDRNITYYLPAQGAEGKNMELSFWYKGNESTLDMFFYDDYNVTTGDFPVPAGAQLLALEVITDTTEVLIDSTIIYDYTTVISSDTAHLLTLLAPESVGAENFDNVTGTPGLMTWNWSGYNYFGYNDWAGQITEDESYSTPKSLWLPGDPGWSGSEGILPGIEDGGSYALSFMYKGKLQLVMKIVASLKYDLANDPDGIVPDNAIVKGGELVWDLSSDNWTDFSFAWEVGTWLADSGLVSPDTLIFDLVGTSTSGDNGYVDDLKFTKVAVPNEVLAQQNFDGLDGAQPLPIDWNWSDAGFFGWNDWAGETVETENFSSPSSLWIPTDPGWSGAGGTIYDVADSLAYSISFMYKGNLKFSLNIAQDLGYDLLADPDGIVPADATVDAKSITWELQALSGWKKFSYAWEQGSWLATEKANLTFTLWDSEAGDGYADDLLIMKSSINTGATPLIESGIEVYNVYAIESTEYDTTYTIENSTKQVVVDAASELEPLAAHFTLPAVTEWTEWKLKWTNPSTDIGSTLTLMLDNKPLATPVYITPVEPEFPEVNASWTYFDDFNYLFTTGVSNKPAPQKQLHLYPNPVVADLYLSVKDPLSKIDIYNSVGQMVRSLNNPERKINVADLSSGIYFINVRDLQGTIYKSKFIKD
jgi:hypothetical protein